MNKKSEKSAAKRYKSYLFAATVLLIGFMYVFSSCDREEDNGNGNVVPVVSTGEMTIVNFTISESSFDGKEIELRNETFSGKASLFDPVMLEGDHLASSDREEETSVVRIADNLYLHATLKEDVAPVSLRSTSLETGSKVRVVAYSGSPGYTTNAGHADYVIVPGGTLAVDGTPPLAVPAGSYKFVAYSFHNTVPLDPFTEITANIPSWDALRGETVVTVGATNSSVQIELSHLFSRVRVQAVLSANLGSIINNMAIPRVTHHVPTLTVQSGVLTPSVGGGSSSSWVQMTWTNSGSVSTWYTHYLPVYMNGNSASVQIDNIQIDGMSYTGPWTINYTTPLASGKEYTLYVRFTKECTAVTGVSLASSPASGGIVLLAETIYLTATPTPSEATDVDYKWQTLKNSVWETFTTSSTPTCNATVMRGENLFRVIASNTCSSEVTSNVISMFGYPTVGGSAARITWDPVNERYALTTDPRDAGLYFRFSSVIGIFSGAGRHTQDLSKGTNVSDFNAAIHVTNNFTKVTISDVYDIPYNNSAFSVVIDTTYHTAANVKAGLGDPCRLVGLDLNNIKNKTADQLTKAEIDNGLWRLPTVQEQRNFSGYTTDQTGNPGVWWWALGENPTGFTFGIPGGEFPEKNHLNGGAGKFLPAVGDRSATGTALGQRERGFFLTNTASSGSVYDGFVLHANYISFTTASRSWFWPARCISQIILPIYS